MNKKLLGIVAAFVVVLGGAFFFASREREATSPKNEEERRQLLAIHDLDLLKKVDAPARDAIPALLRLASTLNPLAKEKAMEWSKSPSEELQLAAVEALGLIFDKDSQAILLKIEKEGDPKALSRISKGVSYKVDSERLKWLQRLEKDYKKPDEARLEIVSGLIKIESDAQKKNSYIFELIQIARMTKDTNLSSRAYARALSQGPRQTDVVKLIHERVMTSTDEQEKAMSLRHLALIKDPKSAEIFDKFSRDPSPVLRKAAIQVIPNICPETRWIVLNESIKSERDRNVLSATLEIPKLLNEPNSALTYQEWLKLEDLSEGEKVSIRNHLQALEAKQVIGTPCSKPEETL